MRILLKTLSYGLMHICVAICVAYLLTGNFLIALSIGLIEPIVQTFFFSAHEYLWEKKWRFGTKKLLETEKGENK